MKIPKTGTFNLWLDDVRPAPTGWVWAKTVAEAKEAFETDRVKEASLDHDLGGRIYVPTEEEETGSHLVRWLAEYGNWSMEKPKVHSMNPVGKRYMEEMIEQYFFEREPEC